jgi:hypothetical protein
MVDDLIDPEEPERRQQVLSWFRERGEIGLQVAEELSAIWYRENVHCDAIGQALGEIRAQIIEQFEDKLSAVEARLIVHMTKQFTEAINNTKLPDVRGTYNATAQYKKLDIVALNGGAFIAKRNDPGPCPGDGWNLLARQGPRGQPGEKGERGPAGAAAVRPVSFKVDRERYCGQLMLSDGSSIEIDLYPFFSQFFEETGG